MKAKKNWSMELVGVCISGGGAVIHDIHRNPACNYSDSRIAPPTLRSTVTLTLHFAEGHQGGKSVCPAPRADLPPPVASGYSRVVARMRVFRLRASASLLRCDPYQLEPPIPIHSPSFPCKGFSLAILSSASLGSTCSSLPAPRQVPLVIII